MLVAIEELSCIFVTIGIAEDARSRTVAVQVVSFIHVTVLELIDTSSIHNVIGPLTCIAVAISITEGALARAHVVFPFALVG